MKAVHVTVLILACGYTGIVPLEAGQVCLQVLYLFIYLFSIYLTLTN